MFDSMGYRIIDKVLGAQKVEIADVRCTHRWNKKSKCTKCEVACPYNAVKVTDSPMVDNYKCTGCGLCVTACPTGVFDTRSFPYNDLRHLMRRGETIVFGCLLNNATGNVTVPCMGSLSEGLLLATAFGNSVALNASRCKKCSAYPGKEMAARRSERVNRLLSDFKDTHRISLTTKPPKVKMDERTDERRLFLKAASLQVANVAESLLRDEATAKKNEKVELGEKVVPRKHVLLVNMMEKLAGGEGVTIQDLPVGTLVADSEKCAGCEMCVTFCPTGALQFDIGEKSARLKFTTKDCVKCDLCIEVCEPGALRYGEPATIDQVIRDEPQTLVDIETVSCQSCGKLTIRTADDMLCLSCKKERELKTSLIMKVTERRK